MSNYESFYSRGDILKSFERQIADHLMGEIYWKTDSLTVDSEPFLAGYFDLPYHNSKMWVILDSQLDVPGHGYRVFAYGTTAEHAFKPMFIGSLENHLLCGAISSNQGFVLRIQIGDDHYHMPMIVTHIFNSQMSQPMFMTLNRKIIQNTI
jgi:hypothetical protein